MQDDIQHALITGGTGSLGGAIVAAFKGPGWMISAPGSSDLDVTDEAGVQRFCGNLAVDLLVCAAGISRDALFVRVTEHEWNETWEVNFKGALLCANAVLPGMLARGTGHIIFISSFSAIHPQIGQSAYATSKAALLGLVADLASRHGHSNIRVNAILPGFLDTPITAAVSARRRAEVLDDHLLGRPNTGRAAANFIRFLHEQMPHTSGQVFQLDSRLDSR